MIYVIDNGEDYSDHSIYFVETDLDPRQMERVIELQNRRRRFPLHYVEGTGETEDETLRSPRPSRDYVNGVLRPPEPRITFSVGGEHLVFMADVCRWWEGGARGLLEYGGAQVFGYALKHESVAMLVKYGRIEPETSDVRRIVNHVLARRGCGPLPPPTPCAHCGGPLRQSWTGGPFICVACQAIHQRTP